MEIFEIKSGPECFDMDLGYVDETRTQWVIKFDDVTFDMIRDFITDAGNEIYERFFQSNMGAMPALSESAEDGSWGWAMLGRDFEIPMSFDKRENKITISLDNVPEDDLERLDYCSPAWNETPSTQWVTVAAIIKKILAGGNIFRLETI